MELYWCSFIKNYGFLSQYSIAAVFFCAFSLPCDCPLSLLKDSCYSTKAYLQCVKVCGHCSNSRKHTAWVSLARDGSLVQLLFEDSAGSIIEHGKIIFCLLVLAVTMAGAHLFFMLWASRFCSLGVFSSFWRTKRDVTLWRLRASSWLTS